MELNTEIEVKQPVALFVPSDDHKELIKTVTDALVIPEDFQVTTAEEYESATENGMLLNDLSKKVEQARKDTKQPFLDAGRDVDTTFKPFVDKLKKTVNIIKGKMMEYNREQGRLQREREAAARKEAEEQERKRQEELAAQAEAAAENDDEEAFEEAVEEMEASTVAVVTPIIRNETPKVKGVGKSVKYKGRVTDLKSLIKAVAEGKAPLSFLKADDSVINKTAGTLKQDFNFPGCEVYAEDAISLRSQKKAF